MRLGYLTASSSLSAALASAIFAWHTDERSEITALVVTMQKSDRNTMVSGERISENAKPARTTD